MSKRNFNGDLPASPSSLAGGNDGGLYNIAEQSGGELSGLTKREHFAAMAMQGILSNQRLQSDKPAKGVAICALHHADALLEELEK